MMRAPWDVVLGAAGAASLLATAAWWTRLPQRLYRALVTRPWFLLGMLAALSPFVVHFILVRAGVFEPAKALPAWIGAPWKAWPNVRQLADVLGPLVGSDPNVLESVMTGQGLALPPRRLPGLSNVLSRVSPLVVMVAMVLLLRVAWSERGRLSTLTALRGAEPSGPVALALINLALAVALYLLQGTCPNASSVRYLVSSWVALPGLLAVGVLASPSAQGVAGRGSSGGPLGTGTVVGAGRHGPGLPGTAAGPGAARRGVRVGVASPPQALIVANLSHGEVGAVEYQPIWDRLGQRYTSGGSRPARRSSVPPTGCSPGRSVARGRGPRSGTWRSTSGDWPGATRDGSVTRGPSPRSTSGRWTCRFGRSWPSNPTKDRTARVRHSRRNELNFARSMITNRDELRQDGKAGPGLGGVLTPRARRARPKIWASIRSLKRRTEHSAS